MNIPSLASHLYDLSPAELDAVLAVLNPEDKEYLLHEVENQSYYDLDLCEFTKQAWHIIEPSQPYVHGWHIDAIAEHLVAITNGEINRLIINVPPGMMKSLFTGVFWPAWEWGPQRLGNYRYVFVSHKQDLTTRDNAKMRRLISSDWYQIRYPHIKIVKDENKKTKFENTLTGFRESCALHSTTGARGDRVGLDDPISRDDANSDAVLKSTEECFLQSIPSRTNNPMSSAIFLIMQRLSERDTTGVALANELGYEHLCLPMEFEKSRRCVTSIGFIDPRTEEGELLFPERFPKDVVERDKKALGTYGTAGQFQQRPVPLGGGIIRFAWFKWYDLEKSSLGLVTSPVFDYIIQSWDTACEEGQENDYSGFTCWGIIDKDAYLIEAWRDKLQFTELKHQAILFANQYNPSKIIIEHASSGISLSQVLRRETKLPIYKHEKDGRRQDKISNMHAISTFVENGRVYLPLNMSFVKPFTDEICTFPWASHDDWADSFSQAAKYIFLKHSQAAVKNIRIMGR